MPVFALPLTASSTTDHSQLASTASSRFLISALPGRKRKRSKKYDSSSSEEDNNSLSSEDENRAASTNPLSLTQVEIAQYKLAGLGINETLPSENVKDFPHRALPIQALRDQSRKWNNKGKGLVRSDPGDSSEDEAKEPDKVRRTERGPRLRLQHLSVLTTILQRCLLEGDIRRATRAYAMLVRGQVSGQAIDLRGSWYWAIGAELLVRSQDRETKRFSYDDSSDSDSESRQREEVKNLGKRWGTKEGSERANDFYERLILQHPYKRQFDASINALDFWPAMLSCEIYGIQFEEREALERLRKEEDEEDGDEWSGSESENEPGLDETEDQANKSMPGDGRRKSLQLQRRKERRWIERDETRQVALAASEKIAARLDELMSMPPYSDSHKLLKIRGMLALYIGDLSVPAMPEDDEGGGTNASRDSGRRFLYRQRMSDHERGKKKQREERERARKSFSRIAKEGGDLEGIEDIGLGEEQEGMHEL
jgi:hypothetical protein